MFDISFSELLVIAVIALLVIGPEKLPKVARTIGALMGRMQRYVGQVKEEVNRELRFEELQKLQQEIKQSVETAQTNIQHQVTVAENSIGGKDQTVSNHAKSVQKMVRKPRTAKAKSTVAKSSNTLADNAEPKKAVKKVVKKIKQVEA